MPVIGVVLMVFFILATIDTLVYMVVGTHPIFFGHTLWQPPGGPPSTEGPNCPPPR